MKKSSVMSLDTRTGQCGVLRGLDIIQLTFVSQVLALSWTEQTALNITLEIQWTLRSRSFKIAISSNHHGTPKLAFVKISSADAKFCIRAPNHLSKRSRFLIIVSAFKVVMTYRRIPREIKAMFICEGDFPADEIYSYRYSNVWENKLY